MELIPQADHGFVMRTM